MYCRIVKLDGSDAVSIRSAETYLRTLREKGFIERSGGRKEGYWRIIPLE